MPQTQVAKPAKITLTHQTNPTRKHSARSGHV